MRSDLSEVTFTPENVVVADHAGLAYDRLAPVVPGVGKVPDDVRDVWLDRLERISIPEGYSAAYRRWRSSFAAQSGFLCEVELHGRLLIGHGNPSGAEVGLSLHHTWGVPMIPGSALKGMLNHYVDAVYGPEDRSKHPMDPTLTGDAKKRARFQGVTWEGKRIKRGPGEVHRALFGAPPSDEDEAILKTLTAGTDDAGRAHASAQIGARQGIVTFHDALFVPRNTDQRLPLSRDVLTVHQKPYYDRRGKKLEDREVHEDNRGTAPNDYNSPIPVSFLSVRPGTRFLIALTGPSDWTQFAGRKLLEALQEWGVGGKTAAGYGRASRVP